MNHDGVEDPATTVGAAPGPPGAPGAPAQSGPPPSRRWLGVVLTGVLVVALGVIAASAWVGESRADAAVVAATAAAVQARELQDELRETVSSARELHQSSEGQVSDGSVRDRLAQATEAAESVLRVGLPDASDDMSRAEAFAARDAAIAVVGQLRTAMKYLAGAQEATNAEQASWLLTESVAEESRTRGDLEAVIAEGEKLLDRRGAAEFDEGLWEALGSALEKATRAIAAVPDRHDLESVQASAKVLASRRENLADAVADVETAMDDWQAELLDRAAESGPSPASEPLAVSAAGPQPIGTVRFLSAGDGPYYGQGFPSGNCTNWFLGLVNQSDTAVAGFTFAPPSGDYTNGYDDGAKEIPAEPTPERVDVFVAPGSMQDVEFQVCTSTPVPSDPAFELSMTAPSSVTFHWVSGHDGTADFGW